MLYITALFFLHQEHVQILVALLPRPLDHKAPLPRDAKLPAGQTELTDVCPIASPQCPTACVPLAQPDRAALPAPARQLGSSFPACGRSASALGLVPAWAGEGLIPGAASLRWSHNQESAVGSSSPHPPPAPEERR